MAETIHQKLLQFKVEILEKQRGLLQTVIEDVDKVLDQGRLWLTSNVDNVTYQSISQSFENKIAQIMMIDEKTARSNNACKGLQVRSLDMLDPEAGSSSLTELLHNDQSDSSRQSQSEAGMMKTILDQMEVMQQAISSLTSGAGQMLEKQTILEERLENLSGEHLEKQEQINKLEAELEKISEKQIYIDERCNNLSNTCSEKDLRTEKLEAEQERVSEKQISMDESIKILTDHFSEKELQIRKLMAEVETVSERQKEMATLSEKIDYIIENRLEIITERQTKISERCLFQEEKIKEQKENIDKLQKQTQELEENLSLTLENNHEFGTRLNFMEANAVGDDQFKVLEQKVESLETTSAEYIQKAEGCDSSLQDLHKKTDDVIQLQDSEFEKLKKLEEKITSVEGKWKESSKETKKQYCDVENKYKMVCMIIADQLVPLEKLRNIFNEKSDARKEHVQKLDKVHNETAELCKKFSALERRCHKPPVGFSALVSLNHQLFQGRIVSSYSRVLVDTGTYFDPHKGVFVSPAVGLYITSLCGLITGNATFFIVKHSSSSALSAPVDDIIGRLYMYQNNGTSSISALVYLEAGDTLFVRCSYSKHSPQMTDWLTLTCFKID